MDILKMVKVAQCPSQYSGSDSTISRFDGTDAFAPSSASSGAGSNGKQYRVRTVRLIRPNSTNTARFACSRPGPFLGFSLRGGREHGTGFFVSAIQPGSEAERQGLQVGDQVIRINGFAVEDAIHKEVLQLISNHKHINLKVRHVGMIPIKDKSTDALGWQIIDDNSSMKRSSPTSRDIILNIAVTGRSKLDCGICKGPDWKPGIFIQFTREGGIAHDVGLRPGDQILRCNNIDFDGMSFNDAVSALKSSKQLELIVRQGAGLDLIAAESSGYNSSASSVTGDQSPSSADSKRLSIVKEETLELEDRLSQLDLHRKWERSCKPTIITLNGNETTIQNNGPPSNPSNIPPPPSLFAKQTVVADIHRTEEPEEKKEPPSLSNAISQELQRRLERKKEQQTEVKTEPVKPKKQHDLLMDEFRKAHNKMFPSGTTEESGAPKRTTHNKPKAPPVPKKTYPPCPQPDYDSTVEMESLESFQLNNPSGPEPKPPSTYFNKSKLTSSVSSGGSVEKRPVSVTFSEYPSGVQRKPPGRFGFLGSTKSCDLEDQPITSRLADELTQTLMRANLKPETETKRKTSTDSTVIINVNNSNGAPPPPSKIQMQHKPLSKTQSVNQLNTSNLLTNNRLTIRISDDHP